MFNRFNYRLVNLTQRIPGVTLFSGVLAPPNELTQEWTQGRIQPQERVVMSIDLPEEQELNFTDGDVHSELPAILGEGDGHIEHSFAFT